jgi:hypothetical protein
MASLLKLSAQSVEYLLVKVTAERLGAAYDPSQDTVEFAFLHVGSAPDANTVWVAGAWESATVAHILVGSDVVLVAGTYAVFVRITAVPEEPVKYAGQVRIY